MELNAATLYVIDDDEEIRRSLEWLFRPSGLRLQAFGSGQEFLEHYRVGEPGCLVLDINLPGMTGLELAQQLRRLHIELPFVIITGRADVPTAVRAMKLGAIDFVAKPFNGRELVRLVKEVVAEELARRRSSADEALAQLTPRERQVMRLLVDGGNNKTIAAALNIGVRTVETHRSGLMHKLGVSSLAELLRLAMGTERRT